MSPCPYPVEPRKWCGPTRAAAKAACTRLRLVAMSLSIAANVGPKVAAAAHICRYSHFACALEAASWRASSAVQGRSVGSSDETCCCTSSCTFCACWPSSLFSTEQSTFRCVDQALLFAERCSPATTKVCTLFRLDPVRGSRRPRKADRTG